MDTFLPILIAVISGSGVLLAIMLNTGGKKKSKTGKPIKTVSRNRNAIIRECTKKISHDPHNITALYELGDLYYTEQDWEKAYPLYCTLYELTALHHEIDPGNAALRQGICAFKIGNNAEAVKSLLIAHHYIPDNFDSNFYLGQSFFQNNELDKALACLKKAHLIKPEASEVNAPLGFTYFKGQKYKESLSYLRRVLDDDPENKEALFDLASAMDECNMSDKALKVFVHLRPDPQFGPRSCLAAGVIHEKTKQYEKALLDYEIGLKLAGIPLETQTIIRYRLANTYIALNNIAKGIYYLKQIQNSVPNYKDVGTLLQRYQELNQNSNLQAYIMSGTSDFVALCRKFVTVFHPDANVKIEDISVAAESIEILCDVDASKWEDTEIFRFYRNSGSIGELYVRDFHSKIHDIKCDKGYCVTAGSFTEEAHKYCEGRPIDLIEKSKLISILKKIDMLD